MNILLIQPPKAPEVIAGEDIHVYEPLALEYIAAGVNGSHDVTILDMRIENDVVAKLKETKPDVVGITAYTTHVNTVKKLFHEVKAWNPDTLTVIGGFHATASPQDFLDNDIDVIVVGEGILAFQDIVSKFEKRGKKPLELFEGTDEKKGKIYHAEKINEDLDVYPFPRRDLTQQYRKHYFSEWMKPLATIVTSKGCYFKCDFCCLWKLTGGRYLKRKPENIVKEMKTIEEEYIFFGDAESMADAKRMEELARLIKKNGIRKKYFVYSRSDTVVKHPGLFKLWKDIGLERIFIGVEFFRDEDMANVKKGATIKDNEAAIKILKQLDIDIVTSFVVRPEFSQEDFKAFAEYCRRLKAKFKINNILISVLTPLPGADFYEKTKAQLTTTNYDHFDLYHAVLPTRLPLKQFYEEYYNLLKKVFTVGDLISLLGKYRLKDIPGAVLRFAITSYKMKNIYKDYLASEKTSVVVEKLPLSYP